MATVNVLIQARDAQLEADRISANFQQARVAMAKETAKATAAAKAGTIVTGNAPMPPPPAANVSSTPPTSLSALQHKPPQCKRCEVYLMPSKDRKSDNLCNTCYVKVWREDLDRIKREIATATDLPTIEALERDLERKKATGTEKDATWGPPREFGGVGFIMDPWARQAVVSAETDVNMTQSLATEGKCSIHTYGTQGTTAQTETSATAEGSGPPQGKH